MEKGLHSILEGSAPEVRDKRITVFVYILQAAGLFIALAFIAGVIIDYVKRKEVKGTWLESHIKWQLRTFWFALLWVFAGVLTYPFLIGFFILIIDGIWVAYRAVKGLLYIYEGKEMYPLDISEWVSR